MAKSCVCRVRAAGGVPHGEGVDVIRESVRMVMQKLIEALNHTEFPNVYLDATYLHARQLRDPDLQRVHRVDRQLHRGATDTDPL